MIRISSFNKFIQNITPKEESSLKVKSIRAGIWTILGRGGSELLRLVSNLILTRLLYPEAFGLMATAMVIVTMIQLFSDTGMKICLIQNPKGSSSEFLNTAWIISIIRGILLFLVAVGLSFPLASFYNQPELKSLLILMSFGILLNGFENPALALIIRKLRADKQMVYELGTQIIGVFTTLLLAYIFLSVWALALGYLLLNLYRLIASYIVEPYRPKLVWNTEAGSELFHFGKYIFLNTLITWTAMNADLLIIGKALNMEFLGYYFIGLNIGILVEMFFIQILSRSYLPVVSSISNDFYRVNRIFRRTSALILTFAVPILIIGALFSKDIIGFLYDPRYAMSAIAMQWICLRGIFRVIGIIQGNTFIAIGKPYLETVSMGVGLILVGILLPYGVINWGLPGVAIAVFIVGLFISVVQSLLLTIHVKFPLKLIIRPWLQTFSISFVIISLFYLLRPYLETEKLYNLPFIMTLGLIGLLLSLGIYLYLEGTNPFKDEIGASQKEAYTL